MNILKQIDEQVKLLKNLGFNVVATQTFKDMLKVSHAYCSCPTHDINYPHCSHIANYCCLWKNDKGYKYAIRICTGGLPEEVIKELELLGYSRKTDVIVYEGVEDAC